MKNIFARIALVAGMVFCLCSGNVQALPYSTLDLQSGSITVGDTFAVQVILNSDGLGEGLSVFGFDVSAGSGTIFSYAGYTLADVFDDVSNPDDADNVSGFTDPGITTDSTLLAILRFTALASGTDTLSILGLHGNLYSGVYYEMSELDISSALDITISPEDAPVPEPATMILLGAGLICLAGFRRKYKKLN